MDNIQKNEIDAIEVRVENTVYELNGVKHENQQLITALNKAELSLNEVESHCREYKEKYQCKKQETKQLRDKIERLNQELLKARGDNAKLADCLDGKQFLSQRNETKNKAYKDIKGIIETFKHETLNKNY